MAHAYLLRCSDGTYYAGSTRHLDERMRQHATGRGCRYTSARQPVGLVWALETESVAQAYAWEKRIQGWSRAKREALIRGDFDALPGLSRRRGGASPPGAG